MHPAKAAAVVTGTLPATTRSCSICRYVDRNTDTHTSMLLYPARSLPDAPPSSKRILVDKVRRVPPRVLFWEVDIRLRCLVLSVRSIATCLREKKIYPAYPSPTPSSPLPHLSTFRNLISSWPRMNMAGRGTSPFDPTRLHDNGGEHHGPGPTGHVVGSGAPDVSHGGMPTS